MTEEALLGWSVVQDVFGVAAAAVILTLFGASERPLIFAIGGLIGFGLLAYVASKLLPVLLQIVRWQKDHGTGELPFSPLQCHDFD